MFEIDLSVLILTWNSADYIERCLRTLVEDLHRTDLSAEIFVVDGGSTDGTIEILSQLAREIAELQVIKLNKNLGTTVSRNIALKRAEGRYLLILDSDTEILPGALKTLCEVIEKEPRAGIVTPRLLYTDGTVQPSCKRFPTVFVKLLKFMPVRLLQRIGENAELYPPNIYTQNFDRILRVDHCISACWLVKRKAMEEVGLLDEHIFYAPEDVDYCLRMWLAGWEILYVPTAQIIHYAQRRSHKSLRMAWVHAKGLAYYFCKHRYFLTRRRLYRRIRKSCEDHQIKPPIGLVSENLGSGLEF